MDCVKGENIVYTEPKVNIEEKINARMILFLILKYFFIQQIK